MVISNYPEIIKFGAAIGLLNFVFPGGFVSPEIRLRGGVLTPPDFAPKIDAETEDPGRGEIRHACPILNPQPRMEIPQLM